MPEYSIGVDLGGTNLRAAAVSREGAVLEKISGKTQLSEGRDAVITDIVDAIIAMRDRCPGGRLAGVGIGVPGFIEIDKGFVVGSNNLPELEGFPVRDEIEHRLGTHVILENDANAAALGEKWIGAGRDVNDLVLLTLGTGIGGGIISKGRVLHGFVGMAGEIGHMTIAEEGPLCRCGNRGCWEALASGTALAKAARKRIEAGADTTILDFAEGKIDRVTAQTVQSAAEQGDPLANEMILKTAYYLGVGVANLINIFNPEMIVIGGGLSNMGERLFKPAHKVVEERAFNRSYRTVRFVKADLGRNSGALGAGAFALDEMKRQFRESRA